MVALKQKEIQEEEQRKGNRQQREEETKEEEKKQKELRQKEIRMMRGWTEEKSQAHIEKFRGRRRDRRCRKCGWFRHMVHHCRRAEIEAEREQRGGSDENRWEQLKCRVMACEEERKAACSVRREAQQLVRCWGCEEEGHHLWMCSKKAARPEQEKAQQRKLVCRECKEKNYIARNCDSYWR